jgi:predicted RNA-binding Zn ribbon-like protein
LVDARDAAETAWRLHGRQRSAESLAVLAEAASQVRADQPEVVDLLDWQRVSLASTSCSTAHIARTAADAPIPDTRLWTGFQAYMLSMRTSRPAREIRELTARALREDGHQLDERQRVIVSSHVAAAMVRTEDFPELLAFCADEINRVPEAAAAWAYTIRAIAHTGIGKPLQAAADAHHALELTQDRQSSPWIGACSALLDAWTELSAFQDASELLDRCELTGDLPDYVIYNYVLHSRGKLKLALGDAAGALADQLECARRLGEWGATNPAMLPWRSYAALAYRILGDRSAAIQLSDEEVSHARAWGTPRALGLALATRAALSWHTGGELWLKEATRHLAQWDVKSTLGLAPRAFGMIRACGAASLADQLELVIMGAGADTVPKPLSQLVDMALSGQTDKQIAQGLAVSTKTVEFHFTRIYQKLGINRRADLATAVRSQGPGSRLL